MQTAGITNRRSVSYRLLRHPVYILNLNFNLELVISKVLLIERRIANMEPSKRHFSGSSTDKSAHIFYNTGKSESVSLC